MDPVTGVAISILSFAIGIFASHATLGKQLSRALPILERAVTDIEELRADVKRLQAQPHFHRRITDIDDA